MKYQTLLESWSSERSRVEQMGTPEQLTTTRRFWKDQFHAYGWEVGFKMSVRFADGAIGRMSFRDIGTDRDAAIGNALRAIGQAASYHPSVQVLWDELKAREAMLAPFKAKISRWQKGFETERSYQMADVNGRIVKFSPSSLAKLSAKFHAMRRNASEGSRPSRKLCTSLALAVVTGRVSYKDAVAQIVTAGGRA